MSSTTPFSSPWLDYFGQVSIIHLRERIERFNALKNELARIGVDIHDERVLIPDAPRPDDSYGFPSRSIYGNFLSHLDILRKARDENSHSVLILEDDAIFRSFFADRAYQEQIVKTLESELWGLCYFGHPITDQLSDQPIGLITTPLMFHWAHCYAVHQRVLSDLVAYLEATIETSAGHPDGGKMYIDGALSMFRSRMTGIKVLVSNPAISIQGGSPSGIATRSWYDRLSVLSKPLILVRAARDELWRRTGIQNPTPKNLYKYLKLKLKFN